MRQRPGNEPAARVQTTNNPQCVLNEVTQIISRQLNVNIRKLTIESNDGIFDGKIQLYVHDSDDVNVICNNLRQVKNIKKVSRVEN